MNDPVVALKLSLIISSFCPFPDTAVKFSIYSVIAWPVQLEKLNKCWFINEFATLLSLHPAAARHIHPGCSCLIRIFPDRDTQSAAWGNNRKWRVSLCQQMSWELTSGPLGILHLVMLTWPRTMPGPRWGSGVGIVHSGMICSDSKYLFVECVFYLMVSGNLRDGPNYLGWEFATSND